MSLIQLTGKHNYVMNTSTPPLLQIITKFLPSQNMQAHQLSSITIEEETYKCLTELDPCKAPAGLEGKGTTEPTGSDNISAHVLKNCATSLTEVY